MKLGIITMFYNEEDLAPFFLKHYSYADRIHVIMDNDTDDDTRKVCSWCRNVTVENYAFPDMMDAKLKQIKLHEVYNKMRKEYDWIYIVDCDEFVFPLPLSANPKDVLAKEKGDLITCRMWQVYRHETDDDLDIIKDVVTQRRHGDPDQTSWYNKFYLKPCVARTKLAPEWNLGCHQYTKNVNHSENPWA